MVRPTDELRALSARMGIDHPYAQEARIWVSSEHHRNRQHTPAQIAEATWLAFLGDFDLGYLDKQGVDARPFLRACIELGFARCFTMFESDGLDPADVLLADAESSRQRADDNLKLIQSS